MAASPRSACLGSGLRGVLCLGLVAQDQAGGPDGTVALTFGLQLLAGLAGCGGRGMGVGPGAVRGNGGIDHARIPRQGVDATKPPDPRHY